MSDVFNFVTLVTRLTVKRTALPTLHQFNKSSWKYDKLVLDHETTLTGDLVYGFELSCWMDIYYLQCYSNADLIATIWWAKKFRKNAGDAECAAW